MSSIAEYYSMIDVNNIKFISSFFNVQLFKTELFTIDLHVCMLCMNY